MRIPAQNRKGLLRHHRGQNVTEYLLVFSGVLVFLVMILRPGGIVEERLTGSLNTALTSFNATINQPCLSAADKKNGGWSPWGGWSGCMACGEFRTRTCDNPIPACGGSLCVDPNGNPDADGQEMETRSCYSGGWIAAACGTCAGACGDTAGICTGEPACPSGCCDPNTKPPPDSCVKIAYPGTWTAFYGACQVSCGAGTQIATIVCNDPDNCCDPDPGAMPATTQSCTNGCCAQTLNIGSGFTGDFPYTADWATATSTTACPSGYSGTPQRECLAGAWSINLVPGTGCVPADCSSTQADATQNVCNTSEAPGCSLTTAFPDTAHMGTGTIDCDAVDSVTLLPIYTQVNGASYTGTATMQCQFGDWVETTLVPGCIPNCPADPQDIGLGLIGPFPETQDPGGSGVSVSYTCSSYNEGLSCGQKRYEGGSVSRTCDAGTWSGLSGSCSYQSCVPEIFCDPTGTGVCGTFGSTPVVAHGTPVTLTCAAMDAANGSRYDGSLTSTCDYGKWCSSGNAGVTGSCTAKGCTAWNPTDNTVSVTFAGTGHDTTVVGSESAPYYTCDAQAKCCFGQWFPTSTNCNSVASVNGVNAYSGSCWAYACQNDFSPANATKCAQTGTDPDDETSLTLDTGWSLVDSTGSGWECAPSTKCEYNCNDGYVKQSGTCVGAVCQGGGFSGALQCSGDFMPVVNTTTSLPAGGCSGGNPPYCEYYCPSGTVRYQRSGVWECCTPYTCGSLGLCSGSTSTSDNCGGTIYCKSCSCTLDGVTVSNNGSYLFYNTQSVTCGNTCPSQWRNCTNGNLDGNSSYQYASCTVGACASCTNTPDGVTILHNNSKTYYSFNQANCNCSSQSRTCNNGTLDGTYTGTTCTGIPCCGDGSCYGPPQPSNVCSNYSESCKTCSDCACTTRTFTVAVNNGTSGRTGSYVAFFPSTASENGCCDLTGSWCAVASCSAFGCECYCYTPPFQQTSRTGCRFYNTTTVNSSASLCSPYTCSTITYTSGPTGSGCGNPGTPGSSCTVTLSE